MTAPAYATSAIFKSFCQYAQEPTIAYFTYGEPVTHPWAVVRPVIRHETPNPFHGLLSDEANALLPALLPFDPSDWPTDAYLPSVAYRKEVVS